MAITGNQRFMDDTKILIISGESETLDLLISALSRGRHDVYLVQSSARAFQAVTDMSPDIVLVDALPSISCMDLCRSIAERVDAGRTSIIVMTEPGDSATGCGGDEFGYIEKPIRIAEVIAFIRAHIELLRLNSELRVRDRRLREEAERRVRVERELGELIAIVQRQPSAPPGSGPPPESDQPCAGGDRRGPIDKLSQREYEVLQFLVQGFNSIDIGQRLHLSDATVRTYRSRIMHKLEVGSFVELIKMSIQWGLL